MAYPCCNCGGDGRCHGSAHYSPHGILEEVESTVLDMVTLSSCEDCGTAASTRGNCPHCSGSGHCAC